MTSASTLVDASIARSGDQPSVATSPRPSAILKRRRVAVPPLAAGFAAGAPAGASTASDPAGTSVQAPLEGGLQRARIVRAQIVFQFADVFAGYRRRRTFCRIGVDGGGCGHGRGR